MLFGIPLHGLYGQALPVKDSVNHSVVVTDPPEVRSPFVLYAVNDPKTGKSAFLFQGKEIPPVIRTSPGSEVHLTYVNHLSNESQEQCVDGRCRNMSNLHFHGLHISPNAPQDDVITMMAMPGESLHYTLQIPSDQPPGLYWYHTHPHGESYQQALDGMSGAIVIDGIERYVPEVKKMRERILILRDRVVEENDPEASSLKQRVEIPAAACGSSGEELERIFTVNGSVRPQIPIAPGERQFWRIVNASPDLYADIQIDTERLEVVALDGMPLAFHDPNHRREFRDHVLVPPAGRVEAIVTGPPSGAHAALRTRCFDTGPDGDPNPSMVMADLVDLPQALPHVENSHSHIPNENVTPVYKPLAAKLIGNLENRVSDFVVTFTEDKQGFYINGKKYGPSDPPMTTVTVGAFQHWRVENKTKEVHPFHIHQVHFLAYAIEDKPLQHPEWLDTVNVPVGGSIDLVMDFTDPIIRGMSLFHCHLLKHEDKGMMAKILFK